MAKNRKSGKKTSLKNQKTTAVSQSPILWYQNTRIHQIIIFLFAFLLYANTLTHEYTQDDPIVIYDNMFTTDGISGIPGILQYDTFYGFFKVEGKDKLVAGGRYRPLTLVLFAIEYQLFGDSSFVGHLGNVLFYGLLGVVLYLLLLKLFQQKQVTTFGTLLALLTTLFFVAHPVHTEVVANIKGRDEIVALLGSLTALLLSWKGKSEGKNWLSILAGIIFFLALLSKENAITFLAIVPLTYYVFSETNFKKIAIQTLPFLAAASLFLIIRGQILGGNFGGQLSMELMNYPFLKIENGQWVHLGFGEKMATIVYTLGRYLQLLLFPHPLTHDYYPRHIDLYTWGNWRVILSTLAYLGIAIAGIIGTLRKKIWGYAALYYLITLSIVSNLLFPIGTNMSERFLFMPSVGFCLIVAYGLRKIPLSLNKQMIVGALIISLFSLKTVQRNYIWKDNFTLFTTDINVSKNSAKLRNSVGGELSARAINTENESQRTAILNEAIGHLLEATKIHPTYKNAYLLLGNAYNYLRQYEKAIEYYNQALKLDPNYTDAFNNRAITYRDAGLFYGQQQGDIGKAIQYLSEAVRALPNDYSTVFGLGVAKGMNNNLAEAIDLFRKATELEPNKSEAWRNLGNAYMNAGDTVNGTAALQKANELQ